jgi:hypothetical protein
MHARHSWLAAAGVTLEVTQFQITAKRNFHEEQLILTNENFGNVDAWVAGLWHTLGIGTEPIAQ